jgi:hypothetical protein
MRRIILVLFMFIIVSCSDRETASPSVTINLPIDSEYSYLVTGTLEITVEDGGVSEDGLSSINFGFLYTRQGRVGIDLTDEVVREAGLNREDLFKNLKVEAVVVESDYGDKQSNLKSYIAKGLKVVQ